MRAFTWLKAAATLALVATAGAWAEGEPAQEGEPTVAIDAREELQALEEQWNEAIARNDVQEIARFMADDWVIIAPDGRITDRERFLAVIESGDLRHDSMRSEDWRVRTYGDAAVVTARTRSEGAFQGQPFSTDERSTSVFVQRDGRWVCVFTQLTPITER